MIGPSVLGTRWAIKKKRRTKRRRRRRGCWRAGAPVSGRTGRDARGLSGLELARRGPRVPTVLTRQECHRLFEGMRGTSRKAQPRRAKVWLAGMSSVGVARRVRLGRPAPGKGNQLPAQGKAAEAAALGKEARPPRFVFPSGLARSGRAKPEGKGGNSFWAGNPGRRCACPGLWCHRPYRTSVGLAALA